MRSAKSRLAGLRRARRLARVVAGICAAAFFINPAARAETRNPIVVGGSARFTVIAPELIRMEFSEEGRFIDEPSMFAVNRDARFDGFELSEAGGATTIDTGRIRLTYRPDGKPFHAGNLKAEIGRGDEWMEWTPGRRNEGNLGGTIKTLDHRDRPENLGEGVLSRDGWHLLDDSRGVLLTEDWVKARSKEAGTDWYLFGYGYDFRAAMRAFSKIGGEVPLPRKYALGVWYSRWWPYSSDDYREIVTQYHENDFPLDVMVMDMDWHKSGWTGWSWNRELLPDAEDLLDWFHREGIFATMNVHPADGVGPHEDMYEDFMRAMGAEDKMGETLLYDAADKKYLDTLFQYTHAPKEADGVNFWWLDWQQFYATKSIPELSNLAWLNRYYFNYAARDGERGLSFSRWGGWGDHRNPVHFSGDAHTDWPMLAFQVPFTATAGNIGCFFWSHDIGGFAGPRLPETYARWTQFGATAPVLRTHSSRSSDLDRRPWTWPKWAENAMRESFHFRSRIFPYIYSSARQSHVETIPLDRPMYFMHPTEEKAYANPQQYYFGDAMLAAPIVELGIGDGKVGFQTVWFPEGVWHNWFTGERFEGPGEALVAADIDEFPLYIKGGAPIPMQPYTERMGTEPLKELIVRCYPGVDGETGAFTLYEDDGISSKHQDGEFAVTELTCLRTGGETVVTIEPANGEFDGQLRERSYVVELPSTEKASAATVDGAPAQAEYDDAASMNRVRIPARSIREGVEARISAGEADYTAYREGAAKRRLAGLLGPEAEGRSILETLKLEKGKMESQKNHLLYEALSVLGAGFRNKNEANYLYGDDVKSYYFAPPGAMDGDSFELSAVQISSDGTTAERIGPAQASQDAFPMPELPPLRDLNYFGDSLRRFLKLDFKIEGEPFSVAGLAGERESHLEKWHIVGPFPFDREKSLAEQKIAPEEGPIDLNDRYAIADDRIAIWKKAKTTDGYIDFKEQLFWNAGGSAAYAVTVLLSKEKQQVLMTVDANDSAVVALNGEVVNVKDGERFYGERPQAFNVILNEGPNFLTVKVGQFRGDWNLKVDVQADKPIKQTYFKGK